MRSGWPRPSLLLRRDLVHEGWSPAVESAREHGGMASRNAHSAAGLEKSSARPIVIAAPGDTHQRSARQRSECRPVAKVGQLSGLPPMVENASAIQIQGLSR
jgi:hypothetical protein